MKAGIWKDDKRCQLLLNFDQGCQPLHRQVCAQGFPWCGGTIVPEENWCCVKLLSHALCGKEKKVHRGHNKVFKCTLRSTKLWQSSRLTLLFSSTSYILELVNSLLAYLANWKAKVLWNYVPHTVCTACYIIMWSSWGTGLYLVSQLIPVFIYCNTVLLYSVTSSILI